MASAGGIPAGSTSAPSGSGAAPPPPSAPPPSAPSGPAATASWPLLTSPDAPHLGLLEGRHPLALGHFVNHPPAGERDSFP